MVTLYHYLILSAVLFSIGLVGVLTRRNIIVIMMSIELMLNATGLNLIAFSKYTNNMDGHIFALMLMTVAAAEAAIGLAILICLFNNKPTVNVDEWNLMKW